MVAIGNAIKVGARYYDPGLLPGIIRWRILGNGEVAPLGMREITEEEAYSDFRDVEVLDPVKIVQERTKWPG